MVNTVHCTAKSQGILMMSKELSPVLIVVTITVTAAEMLKVMVMDKVMVIVMALCSYVLVHLQ